MLLFGYFYCLCKLYKNSLDCFYLSLPMLVHLAGEWIPRQLSLDKHISSVGLETILRTELVLPSFGTALLPGVDGVEHNSQHGQQQTEQAEHNGEYYAGFASATVIAI